MGFAEEHQKWLEMHLKRRTGERLDRLKRGHGHGEKLFAERVWWPIFGHFADLHPEYEVSDFRGRPYFVDFVWRSGQVKLAVEVKGYGPHVQNMDRTKYRQELNRETYLQIAGYRVIAVPYDDLESVPELTVSLFKALVAPFLLQATGENEQRYTSLEKDILRTAAHWNGPIRPVDLIPHIVADPRTIRKSLQHLCELGKFRPLRAQGGRINRYEYIHSFGDNELW